MKPIPATHEFLDAAKRIVWCKDPVEALHNPDELMAYAMKHATDTDMALLLDHIGRDGLVDAVDHAPPVIIDPRSWSYWNVMIGRFPTPPMPMRQLPDDGPS